MSNAEEVDDVSMSGDELDDDLPDVMSLLPANANMKEVTEALRDSQIQNLQLKSLLKKLQLNSVSQETAEREGKKRKSKVTGIPEALSPYKDEIAKLARQYSLTICPWIDADLFTRKGRPDVDPNAPSRWETDESKLEGAIAELYDFLPPHFHKLMERYPKFQNLFRTHMNNQRSNAISSVRQKVAMLYRLDQKYFESTFARGDIPELQKLIRNPKPGKSDYYAFPPVLFKDFRYDSTLKTLFLNDLIPGIIRTMLFGRAGDAKSKPQTLAQRWGLKEATPGLIAFAAILARYYISPDEELRPLGATTGINWLADFNQYKRALSLNSKRVQDIFAFINEKAFAVKSISQSKTANKVIDDVDDFEDALRQLEEDDYSSNPEGDEDDGLSRNASPPPSVSPPPPSVSPPPASVSPPPASVSPPPASVYTPAPPSVTPSVSPSTIAVDIRIPLQAQLPPNTASFNSISVGTASASQSMTPATETPIPLEHFGTTSRRSSGVLPLIGSDATSRRSSGAFPTGPTSRRSSGLVPSFIPPAVEAGEVPPPPEETQAENGKKKKKITTTRSVSVRKAATRVK